MNQFLRQSCFDKQTNKKTEGEREAFPSLPRSFICLRAKHDCLRKAGRSIDL